uniref:Dirigent protein n=1 Tax=Oryza punctata TaxID=4537 RepID=A0A0E0JPQ7_ORYPU
MSKNSTLIAAALLLLVVASLAAALLYSAGPRDVDGLVGVLPRTTLPFSPMDVLPLLPRTAAMAALRALRGVSDIFPVFVGAASARPGAVGARLEWKGACFYENEAWLVFHNDSGTKYGGGTLHIKVRPVSA